MSSLRSLRIDSPILPSPGTASERIPAQALPQRTSSDQVRMLRGKPSGLRMRDLTPPEASDRVVLSPAWQRARLEIEPALMDRSALQDARRRLAEILDAAQRQGRQTSKELDELCSLKGDLDRLLSEQRFEPATLLDSLARLSLHPSAFDARLDRLLNAAAQRLLSGDPRSAKVLLRRVSRFRPDDDKVLALFGRCCQAEGDPTQARSILRRALARTPSDGSLWLELGKASYQLGDRVEAKQAFFEASFRNQDHAEPFSWLGIIAYGEGNQPEALRWLQKAISLDPGNAPARFYLAQISLQQNDPLRASFQLGVVRKLDPEIPISDSPPQRALPASGGDRFYDPFRWVIPALS